MFTLIRNVFFIALIFTLGCGKDKNINDKNSDNKLQVYASVYPIYDFAKKIGGEKIDVYNTTSAGAEPHDFEITSKDMANLSKADLFVYNGGGMEHWVETVKESLKNIKYLEASAGIENDNLDPHFWLSPKKAKKEMENIKNALTEIDGDNSRYYESNYNLYAERLDELDLKIKNSLYDLKNRYLIVTHPAFGHFCEEYSLNQIAVARDEADPKAVAEVIDFIKKNGVKTVFYEEFSSSRLADAIVKETGVKVSVLNPIESLSEEYINLGEDYFSIMEKNLKSLIEGLN